jgi:hypothetical protein
MVENRFISALRILNKHAVDYILVGGVASSVRGAIYNTRDLDVVHSRTPENIGRLLAALRELNARYIFRPEFVPNQSHLASPGQQLLSTDLGRIDVLGKIGPGWDYAELLGHSSDIELVPGVTARVLDLETIIASKEASGGEKDLAVLPLLRRTLQELRRRQPAQLDQP